MAQGYEIRSHGLLCPDLYVLAKEGKDDFIESMCNDSKHKDKAQVILTAVERISDYGIEKCLRRKQFLRYIDSQTCLVEVKIQKQVLRIMTYYDRDGSGKLILLFDFMGHQGSNKIKKTDVEKGKKLAKIAKDCLGE